MTSRTWVLLVSAACAARAQHLPLPPLPYEYDALEPHMDEATMRVHHLSHAQTYTDKLNAALGKLRADAETKWLAKLGIDELLGHLDQIPEGLRSAIRNAGGGYVNHDLFFASLSPNSGEDHEPTGGPLHEALVRDFGSVSEFKKQFTLAALELFGSGWTWLVLDPASGKLEIDSTANQDTPLMARERPLLGIDLWEHAYYLKHQSRRKDYIADFWRVVDWASLTTRYEAEVAAQASASAKAEL